MTDAYRDDFDAFRRAFAVAQWELGDASWADVILRAYFDPYDEGAAEAIRELEAAEVGEL
jgi:hypothetical protein